MTSYHYKERMAIKLYTKVLTQNKISKIFFNELPEFYRVYDNLVYFIVEGKKIMEMAESSMNVAMAARIYYTRFRKLCQNEVNRLMGHFERDNAKENNMGNKKWFLENVGEGQERIFDKFEEFQNKMGLNRKQKKEQALFLVHMSIAYDTFARFLVKHHKSFEESTEAVLKEAVDCIQVAFDARNEAVETLGKNAIFTRQMIAVLDSIYKGG